MFRRIRINIRRRWRRVISQDDTPDSIAKSVSIGTFVAWQPVFGLQMVLAFCLCWLARVNRIAGVLVVWVTNPVTIPPIFYMNYLVGRMIVPATWYPEGGEEKVQRATEQFASVGLLDFFDWERLRVLFDAVVGMGAEVFIPLTLGSILIGFVLALIAYPVTKRSVIAFQVVRARRKRKKIQRKNA